MKRLSLFVLLLLVLFPTSGLENDNKTIVYICYGTNAYAFHAYSSCRGLSNCKGEIRAISLDEAQKMGRKPCGICYK